MVFGLSIPEVRNAILNFLPSDALGDDGSQNVLASIMYAASTIIFVSFTYATLIVKRKTIRIVPFLLILVLVITVNVPGFYHEYLAIDFHDIESSPFLRNFTPYAVVILAFAFSARINRTRHHVKKTIGWPAAYITFIALYIFGIYHFEDGWLSIGTAFTTGGLIPPLMAVWFVNRVEEF